MPSTIKVEPPEINFNGAVPGTLYVMTLSVRNMTLQAQRIRIKAPRTPLFALNYIPSGVIAPGLDLRAEIECQIPAELDNDIVFTDSIVAMMGDERVEIPIVATKPVAKIDFQKSISLGNVLLYQSINKDIEFHNKSSFPGSIKLATAKGSKLKLSSQRLDFAAVGEDGSSQVVQVSLDAREVGPLRELIRVSTVGSLDEMRIDISAQVSDQQFTLLTENKQGIIETAKFGDIFFGDKRSINAILVNSGPLPMSFSLKYEDEEDQGPQTDGPDVYVKSFTVSPVDGTVKPFSSMPITMTFAPNFAVPDKGFLKQHLKDYEEPKLITRVAKIECLDTIQVISFSMTGCAFIPTIAVSPTMLRFGDCPVNDRRDILLTLTNKTRVPTQFEFPIVATFKFEPSKGKILPHENCSVVATFLPPQLGTFKTILHMIVAGGLNKVDVKVVGEASTSVTKTLVLGTDKLPADFAPRYKFVDPEEEEQARLEKRQQAERKEYDLQQTVKNLITNDGGRKGFFKLDEPPKVVESSIDNSKAPSIINAASEQDDLYGTQSQVTRKVEPQEEFQRIMYEHHKAHNQYYNDYLQNNHTQRELLRMARAKAKLTARGTADFSDPFGTSMGIERGLEEPQLKIPKATELLWTMGSEGPGVGQGGGAGNSRRTIDENRLINKKYDSTPATQAELRDCSKELSTEDLKLVTASHKIIDFGKVCVGSLTPKNFVVFNSLMHAILVTIEDLDIELKQSKFLSQIIPPGCMAGYDLYFSSRALGKVKKLFSWKINGLHVFKTQVVADVVPIELILNKTDLCMEFPADLLKRTLTSDIILTNPGNANADFLWGNVGAFSCDPEKGQVPAGKSSVVSITWDPFAGKRMEEELGLHVSGGIDQVLKVKGILKETKADFSEKRLSLGTMAVGTEKEFTTSIINVGENSLVFFLSESDPSLGIQVTPMEGFILPGESMEIQIKVTPKAAKSYDNTSIQARIRGGKPISIKFSGSSIIPQVELKESSFSFGAITVGNSTRMPLTLVNKSQISATMILDLSKYSDFAPSMLNMLEKPDLATKEFGPEAPLQEDEYGNRIILQQDNTANVDVSKPSKKKGSKRKNVAGAWKIVVAANSTLTAELIFRPTQQKKHSFRLPLHLFGIIENRSYEKDVTATSTTSILKVSNMAVDFGDRVVSRDPMARVSYFLETVLTNQGTEGATFIMREGEEVARNFDGSIVDPSQQKLGGDPTLTGGEPQQIFFVSPLSFDLAPGQSSKFRVTFQPQENVNYSKKLHLYKKGQDENSRPYLSLLCIGTGVYPCLTFSTESLCLPSVPLGVTSRAQFTIFNNGYTSLELKHRLSPNVTIPVDISYPDGNSIGIMVDRIRVVVAAKSDQPVSWQGKLEFYDSEGERFVIVLSGCHDNCLLTNYNFIRNYSSDYGFIGIDDQPVQFLPQHQIVELRQIEAKKKEEMRKLRSLERQKAVGGGKQDVPAQKSVKIKEDSSMGSPSSETSKKRKPVPPAIKTQGAGNGNTESNDSSSSRFEGVDIDKPLSPPNEEAEAIFLLTWLNRVVCRKPFDIERYPYCMFDQTGDTVIDCIEQMSGKKITNLKMEDRRTFGENRKSSADGNRADAQARASSEKSRLVAAAEKVIYKYQAILNFLIAHGALLSHISPVAMASLEEYLLIQEHELTRDKSVRITSSMLHSRQDMWNEQWLQHCSSTWLEVMYQAVRVFMLSRLTFKDYSRMPGIVLNTRPDLVANKSKGKQAKALQQQDPVPKDLLPSNVFTHSEAVLLAWASYHLERAEGLVDEGAKSSGPDKSDMRVVSFNKRVTDIDAVFRNVAAYCQIFHSHVIDVTQKNEPLHGYTSIDSTMQDRIFDLFEDAMVQYRCSIKVTASQIMASTRNTLIMLLHLYMFLPNLIPKAKIDCMGLLGVPIMKKIELKNPAKKPLVYKVTMKGCEDFSPESDVVTVPPEGTADFMVTLNARFQHSVQAKIYFWSEKDASYASGTTICFQFISQITGIKPVEQITRNIGLFEYETFQLHLKNPFPDHDVTLHVKLDIKFCAKSVGDIVPGRQQAIKKGAKNSSNFVTIPLTKPEDEDTDDIFGLGESQKEEKDESPKNDDWELENMFQQPFWLQDEVVVFNRKDGMKIFPVFMLPFKMGKYICQVNFIESEMGELSYQIAVDVGLPKPADRLDGTVYQGSTSYFALGLNSKNPMFEKAYGIITDTRVKNANKKIKARGIFQNLMSAAVLREDTGQANFLIDFTAPFFNCKRIVPFVSEYQKWSKGGSGGLNLASKTKKTSKNTFDLLQHPEDDGLNRSIISFSPARAGQYKATAIVYPEDNPNDIRCIELSLNARVPDAKMAMEFSGPARQVLSQEVPITNETESPWNLTVLVTGKGFSGPKSISVPARGCSNLEIKFLALCASQVTGKLQLRNTLTSDIFEYTLIGESEEPLAEDSLSFRCPARKKTNFSISLPSLATIFCDPNLESEAKVFRVESDLPFMTCAETCRVGNNGTGFQICVNSPLGGKLSGYVAFKEEETGAMIWYTVGVDVTSPAEEKTIEVQTVVRRACAVDITLVNPISEDLVFDVSFHGDGLLGESSFVLPPKSGKPAEDAVSSTYELIYSPLIAGESIGRVTFTNERVGELWYKLLLKALPANPIILESVESMVGSDQSIMAPVENPLSEAVTFTVESSDPEHFILSSTKLTLSSFAQTNFEVKFRPSALNEVFTASIVLTNRKLGEIRYEVQGRGTLPGVMPLVSVEGPLHEIVSENIVFRNPFPRPLPLEVLLIGDNSSSSSPFSLLLRRATDIVIPAKAQFHIPIGFSPSKMGIFSCTIHARSSVGGHNLLWCYPVQGIAEVGQIFKIADIKAPSKTSTIKEQLVPLSGIKRSDLAPGEELKLSDFSIQLKVEDELKNLVLRTFHVQALEIVPWAGSHTAAAYPHDYIDVDFALRCRLVFEPLRVYSCSVDISIVARQRGKWRARTSLEATDPEPDDIIKLIASVGSVDCVSFKLKNRFLGYSNFQAFFTSNSSPHFTVSPEKGVFPPYESSDGTQFTVTFTPKGYGYIETATLNILTDDAQWTYQFKGSYPDSAGMAKMKTIGLGAQPPQPGSLKR